MYFFLLSYLYFWVHIFNFFFLFYLYFQICIFLFVFAYLYFWIYIFFYESWPLSQPISFKSIDRHLTNKSSFVFIHSLSHLLRRFSLILESGWLCFLSSTMVTSVADIKAVIWSHLKCDQITGIYKHISQMVETPLNHIFARWSRSQYRGLPIIFELEISGCVCHEGCFLTQCSPASPSREKFASSPRCPSWELRWISCGGKHWRDRPCGARSRLHPGDALLSSPRHRHSYHSPMSAPEDRRAN